MLLWTIVTRTHTHIYIYIYVCVCVMVAGLQEAPKLHYPLWPCRCSPVGSKSLFIGSDMSGDAQRKVAGRVAGDMQVTKGVTWTHGTMGCDAWVFSTALGVGFFGQPEVRSGIFRSYMSKAIIRAPLMRWFGQAQGKLWSQCSAREIGALVCFTWIREPGADGVTFVNRRSMIARLARRSMTKSGLFACEF